MESMTQPSTADYLVRLRELPDDQLTLVADAFVSAWLKVAEVDEDPKTGLLGPLGTLAYEFCAPIEEEQERRRLALLNAEVEVDYNGHRLRAVYRYDADEHRTVAVAAQCWCGWEGDDLPDVDAARGAAERHAEDTGGALLVGGALGFPEVGP